MSDKIVELNAHKPTPDSVIERLDRYRGNIDNITAVVTWDNGVTEVYGDLKPLKDLAFELEVMHRYVKAQFDYHEEDL